MGRSRRSFADRGRKPETLRVAFTGYESFVYLLTELELVVEGGTIAWSTESAEIALLRFARLSSTIRRVIAQSGKE
jgi:hypothetical protein